MARIEVEYITVFKTAIEIEDKEISDMTGVEILAEVMPEFDTEVDIQKRTIISTKVV